MSKSLYLQKKAQCECAASRGKEPQSGIICTQLYRQDIYKHTAAVSKLASKRVIAQSTAMLIAETLFNS